jgi:DNA-binding transcriptional ArsR family regulator
MNEPLRKFKAQIFQALANPTRIAMVDALRDGEMSAGALMTKLNLEQANASQHLAVLRAKQVVANRRAGNQVYYSLRDPVLIDVLDLMRRYFQAHLNETASMLGEMDEEAKPLKAGKPGGTSKAGGTGRAAGTGKAGGAGRTGRMGRPRK